MGKQTDKSKDKKKDKGKIRDREKDRQEGKKKDQDAPGHSNHLCAVIAGGYGFEQVHALVRDPRYICAKCGRAAAEKHNLCKARKL